MHGNGGLRRWLANVHAVVNEASWSADHYYRPASVSGSGHACRALLA